MLALLAAVFRELLASKKCLKLVNYIHKKDLEQFLTTILKNSDDWNTVEVKDP